MSAVSPGLASVTAKAKDKDLLVQCDVTVTGKPVKSIKLNKTSLSLQEGSSEQLKVTIDPQDATNQTIKYTSNNTKIATVDSNGLVKGISKGSALITSSSADGGFVSECKVNVNAKPEEAKPAPILYKPTKPSSAPKGSNLLFSKKGGYMMVYVYRHIGAIEQLTPSTTDLEIYIENDRLCVTFNDVGFVIDGVDHFGTTSYVYYHII